MHIRTNPKYQKNEVCVITALFLYNLMIKKRFIFLYRVVDPLHSQNSEALLKEMLMAISGV